MQKFEVGKTYEYRFIGDSDLVVAIKVIKRTKSFLTFEDGGEVVRKKISTNDEGEYISPKGVYSMSPICRAKNIAS